MSTPEGQPSEAELRAAYEAELSRITSAEMVIQSAVSLLNLGGRRLGLGEGGEQQRDLEQARDAIDAVRGLLPVLERRMPQEIAPLRDALAQLQMAYARETQGAAQATGAPAAGDGRDPAAGEGSRADSPSQPGSSQPPSKSDSDPGEGESAVSSGRLWIPGS